MEEPKKLVGYAIDDEKNRITVHNGVFENTGEAMAWSHTLGSVELHLYDVEEEE